MYSSNSAVHLNYWQGYSVKFRQENPNASVEVRLCKGNESISSQILNVPKNVNLSVTEQPKFGRVVVKSSDGKVLVHVNISKNKIYVIANKTKGAGALNKTDTVKTESKSPE